MTAHFVGSVVDEHALELDDIAARVAGEFSPIGAHPERVGTFGPDGSGRTAVLLHLGGWGIEALPGALMRRTWHLPAMERPQHPDYKPHLTLGYTRRELTPADVANLADIKTPDGWSMTLSVLQLSRGEDTKSWTLSGARRDTSEGGE